MKTPLYSVFLFFLCIAFGKFSMAQFNIGSNTQNPYAVLNMQSADSSQGLIVPYVTTVNRPSPSDTTQGMIIFNITDSVLQYCDGVQWVSILHPDSVDFTPWRNTSNNKTNSITETISHTGNVQIGANTSFVSSQLYVVSPGQNIPTGYFRSSDDGDNFLGLYPDNGGHSYMRIQSNNAARDVGITLSNSADDSRWFIINGSGSANNKFLLGNNISNSGNGYVGSGNKNEASSYLGLTPTGELQLFEYGSGNVEANDLSVSESSYIMGFATDGTAVEVHKDSLANDINDNDWILDANTLYSGPDSTVVIKGGNVGIGITNPSSLLDVRGTNPTVQIKANSGATIVNLDGAPATGNNIYFKTNGVIQWHMQNVGDNSFRLYRGPVSGTNLKFILNSAGWLGLGNNTTPQAKFHIHNDVSGNDSAFVVTDKGHVGIGTSSPSSNYGMHIVNESASILMLERSSDQNVSIHFKNTDDEIFVGFNQDEHFAIGPSIDLSDNPYFIIGKATNEGNVGINTSSPDAKFHVHNDVSGADSAFVVTRAGFVGVGTTNPDAPLYLKDGINYPLTFSESHNGAGSWAILHNAYINNSGNYIWSNTHGSFGSRGILMDYRDGSAGGIKFYADRTSSVSGNTFSPSVRMIIQNDGNVGIGTTSPDTTLHIEGGIKIVDGNEANGYVLQSDANGVGTWVDPSSITAADDEDWVLDGDTLYSAPDSTLVIKGGNVGVGTVDPNSKIEIIGTVRFNSTLYFTAGTNYTGNRIKYTGSGYEFFGSGTNGAFIANSPASESFINSNVGIGIVNPDNRLHVSASSDPIKLEGLENDASLDTVVTVDANGVLHKRSVSSIGDSLSSALADHDWYEEGTTSSPNAITDNIYTQGNVGIGTNSPGASLELGSSATSGHYINVLGSSTDSVIDVFVGNKKWPRLRLRDASVGGSSFSIWNIGNTLRFGTSSGIITNTAFYIKAGVAADAIFNGNIGIGVSSPTNKLHVIDSIGDPVRLYGLVNDASLDTIVTVDANGVLHKTASFDIPTPYLSTVSINNTYTALSTDNVVLCDASSGGFTVTLPSASGLDGKTIIIKKAEGSTNVVVVDGDGAETIDGAATVSLNTGWQKITMVSDGSNWFII